MSTPADELQRKSSADVHPDHRDALTLVLITAVAIVLRVLFLDKSLWLDEGVAVANAWANGLPLSVWQEWLRGLWHAEFNMVSYFALLRVWLRAGNGEAFIRLLSVIPAVATVPLVYIIGKRLANARAGIIAALLLAVHGAHVLYSQEARGYTLVVFLTTVSTYFFIAGIELRRRKYWVLYWIVSTLAIYSHFFGGLVLVAQWVSLRWLPKSRLPWRSLILSAVAIILTALPAAVFVLTNRGQQVDWIPRLNIGQGINVVSEFAGNPLALPVYIVLWFFGIREFLGLSRGARHSEEGWHVALIISWLVVPFALATLVSLKRPMLVPRYLLISAPAAVLLAGAGALQLNQQRRKIAIWVAVLLSVAFIGFRYGRSKEDWRGASRFVLTNVQASDAVIVVPWWSEQPFAYYLERWPGPKPTEIQSRTLHGEDELSQLSHQHRRIWLVVYARPQGLNDPETHLLEEALATAYPFSEERKFNLVAVRLYSGSARSQP